MKLFFGILTAFFCAALVIQIRSRFVKRLVGVWGRTSLAAQWLGLQASTAGGRGSIPGLGTKIPHATQPINK